jgi:hypothetical protein
VTRPSAAGPTRPDAGTIRSTTSSSATATRSGASGRIGTSPGSKLPCKQVICVFVLDKGRLTAFAAPGQGTSYFPRINNRGQIVGAYIKQQSEPLDVFGGYLRDRRGRTTTFDVPGAASTLPMDLNDHGQIVGIQRVDAQGPVAASCAMPVAGTSPSRSPAR